MGRQQVVENWNDDRIDGDRYWWEDKYGNTYCHYKERQKDGKFYGEFYNRRTKKTIRFWFAKKKLVYAKLEAMHDNYTNKWNTKAENLAKKRAEREALKPKLTAKELKAKKIQAKMNKLQANIRRNQTKVRRCSTRIKTDQRKLTRYLKVLDHL